MNVNNYPEQGINDYENDIKELKRQLAEAREANK